MYYGDILEGQRALIYEVGQDIGKAESKLKEVLKQRKYGAFESANEYAEARAEVAKNIELAKGKYKEYTEAGLGIIDKAEKEILAKQMENAEIFLKDLDQNPENPDSVIEAWKIPSDQSELISVIKEMQVVQKKLKDGSKEEGLQKELENHRIFIKSCFTDAVQEKIAITKKRLHAEFDAEAKLELDYLTRVENLPATYQRDKLQSYLTRVEDLKLKIENYNRSFIYVIGRLLHLTSKGSYEHLNKIIGLKKNIDDLIVDTKKTPKELEAGNAEIAKVLGEEAPKYGIK